MNSIAVIGGGAGGSLVAAQLLRQAKGPLKVTLIERAPEAGPGVAYATSDLHHLLNVPAGKMGAYPDDPGHFVAWMQRHPEACFGVAPDPTAFVPRALYGRYLRDVLEQARYAAQPGIHFQIRSDEAVDIEELPENRARVYLAQGEPIDAHRVVLALGTLPGEYPVRRPLRFYHGLRYVHVPWAKGAFDRIGPKDDVLIVGAGLTAVDVLIHLDGIGHKGTVHALSRNGLRPLVHKAVAPYRPFLDPNNLPTTIRALVRLVRAEVKKAAAEGFNWRAVVDAIRPQAQAAWQALSWEERGRFLRHVRPFWEVHRHRIAPKVHETVLRLEAEGRVRFHAGRLQDLKDIPGAAEAQFRQRGTDNLVRFQVSKVINCTGPRTDYSKYQHPLLINLLARGLIDHDPLALGVQANPDGAVLRHRNGPVGWLFTLGAPLKGVLWESTAMPEIRAQAKSIATKLLETPLLFP
jgi:uncharacterized NAD(P)/FAD-binding protein YdhS